MAECIDCKGADVVAKRWFKEIVLNRDACIDGLNPLLASDVVERNRGRWYIDGNGTMRCSECKEEALLTIDAIEDVTFSKSNFCPNCGAKMEALVNEDL